MAQVHADPDKLRSFSKELRRVGDELESRSRALLKKLGSIDWDDSERTKFEGELQTVIKALTQFSRRLSEEYAPQLEKKARALDRFRG